MGQALLTVNGPGQRQHTADLAQLPALLSDAHTLLWLDLQDPGPAELALLRREFGFHELALEDVVKRHQRPKCDLYDHYYFIVIYVAEHSATEFCPRELQLFWGTNYLVTIHDGPLAVLDEARRRWEHRELGSRGGVAQLVYTLLDSIVDGYFPLQDWVGERVEAIEEAIFAHSDSTVLTDLFRLRKDLLQMRKLLAPTRDVLNELLRRDLPLFPPSLRPYFNDVYDHTLRILDGLDTYRDLLASALDVYLSATSNRLNQLVKRMTALTLIVMVPTLIAGIYGMNFTHAFPSYELEWGFWLIIGLMATLMAAGVALARRLDWL